MREWLDGQAAGGLVAYDADADTYELGPEAAMALADDTSPVFVARAMNTLVRCSWTCRRRPGRSGATAR